ncbi:increased DNA methylation 1-like [Apium graveolens]|uniref:increased DNA methylation 1-like n=1 Tax=Apium graveolens TaxID=4045 RepID=UPI003D7AE12F
MGKNSETQRIIPKFNPQAIVDYCNSANGLGGKRKEQEDLILKAKQHLLAEGWCFSYAARHRGNEELRYSPGIGQKKYFSLRTACMAYLHNKAQLDKLTNRISRIKFVREDVKACLDKQPQLEEFSENRVIENHVVEDVDVCFGSFSSMQREKRKFWIDLFGDSEYNDVVTQSKNSSFDDMGSFDARREDFKLDEGVKRRRLGGKNMNDLIKLRDAKRKINGRGRVRGVNNQLKDVNNEILTQNLEEHSNDDVCSICREGGDLMLCDKCPSAFHAGCHGLSEIPPSEFWYCLSCCCGICGDNLCRDDSYVHDKQCDQCERCYHGKCIGGYYGAELEREEWFCSRNCEAISFGLNDLLGKPIIVGGNNLTWTLLKKNYNVNDPWTNKRLKGALSIMHECFKSVKEPWGGRDVGEDVIFSRKSDLKQLDFRGFYTVILQKGARVAAFATVRVFGDRVAELPFIATRLKYRSQGMCKTLMNVLEEKLFNLGVQKLVLPSMLSVLDIWTSPSFAFKQMTASDRSMLMGHAFLEFSGTVACQKVLQESRRQSVR